MPCELRECRAEDVSRIKKFDRRVSDLERFMIFMRTPKRERLFDILRLV